MSDAAHPTAENRISIEMLDSLFSADFAEGKLYWRERVADDYRVAIWNNRFAGRVAGRINSGGHRQIIITLDGKRIHTSAHRVLWAMKHRQWPARDVLIDHVDGQKDDNRDGEIRPATRVQNAQNRRMHSNNSSGFKGVSWVGALGRWIVLIQVNKKTVRLGYFDDPKKGAIAYDEAAVRYHGAFARTNAMLGLL